MPTYTVSFSSGSLDTQSKARVAAGITAVHHDITGAPACFAQVIFREVEPGNYFVGGTALSGEQLFINGQVRAGRGVEVRQRLLDELVAATAEACGLAADCIWVYLNELPAHQMVEFGHTLPPAGDEAAWLESLPREVRDRVNALNRGGESV